MVTAAVSSRAILIAGPHESRDEQAKSINDIMRRTGIDLNFEPLVLFGLGGMTKKCLVAQLNVHAAHAEAAGFSIMRRSDDEWSDNDFDVEISFTPRRRR